MRTAAVVGATVGAMLAIAAVAPAARADDPSPLYALVDAAAHRLQTAQDVAASKWITGGPIQDPPRERQVLDAVSAEARDRGVDQDVVRRAFRDQIDATVAVEYGLFSDWKLDPAGAPTTAPDLAASRTTIDTLNRTIVNEIASQWGSLHSPACDGELAVARDAVVAERRLDDRYGRALAFATRSYCG
ncbi:secreted chorismate mutase [Mycolicibacterium madagascariense]|uniref:Chorismate mutase n=1 Tax=Mycolicibacterium madagascariense TaxID=212765 RepID=A0A7I7X918_9MYCO|nr:chorismate mutase [Mycolicibacterium madagascariense]MCV7012818.1 chorismate mutase [Mycolicibacterium madagascariense]BBZ26064.1 secreted chorismate mutase [Mycolicibacterium madagascariense]